MVSIRTVVWRRPPQWRHSRLLLGLLLAWISSFGYQSATAAPAADQTSPPATTLSPANGATDICPDTPLKLIFAAPPTLGTAGQVQIFDAADNTLVEAIDISIKTKSKSIGGISNFNYYPILITGNQAAIFPAKTLDARKTYYVTIDPNVFTGIQGLDNPQAWRFTTRAAPSPAPGTTKWTIAADGSGDFCTIQGAIDALPTGNTTPTTLFIRNGTYREMVVVNNKHALTFLGEDRKKTIVAYPDNARLNAVGSPYRRGMFLVNRSNDVVITNLTLHNTTPKGGTQAESLILAGSVNAHAILTNLDLYSFQDTLQINGQAYVSHTYIEGDVDFMWGAGPTFFENCECKSLNSRGYFTQIRNPAANHGYIYSHCLFSGKDGVTGNLLSRIDPGRFPASEVVLLDCTLSAAVSPAAWRFDVNNTGPNVHFWEYRSHDADGKPIDMNARFPPSKRLDTDTDAEIIAHYRDPNWVLGSHWTPALTPLITAQPVALTVAAGQKAAFAVTVSAVPDPTYQWQKNGIDIPAATNAAYSINRAAPSDAAAYTVVITNAAGQTKSAAAALQLTP